MNPSERPEIESTRAFAAGGFVPPDVSELASQLPNLEVLEFLGHGGMGAVYKGRQPLLERPVAIKIVRPDFKNNAELRERFLQEARALARLRHPYIVSVYDIGLTSDLAYLVMEFVDGVTLRKRLSDGPLAERDALDFVPQICEALEHAHESGVVHRDVKPENVVLDQNGRVRLVDFGLASLAGASSDAVADDVVVGTLGYMAPEQMLTPQSVDHRADIYSLGVVLHETLTGRLPGADRQLPSAVAGTDRRLDAVVQRATDGERERRYQQARGMRMDLVEVSRTPPSTIVLEQEVPASRERIFAAWTDPAEMTDWYAPTDEFATPIAEVDLRIGGDYRIGMRPPGQEVRIVTGQFCRIEPPNCVSFTWAWQPPHFRFPETQVTMELQPRGDVTNVVLTHERFRDQGHRDGHEEGWTGCLKRLRRKFAK